MTAKSHCLMVLTSAEGGVSAQSFIQSFTLVHSAFHVQLATPEGKNPVFQDMDEQSERWLADFRTKAYAVPISLQTVDAVRYSCLIIPHSVGATEDLADDKYLGEILQNFVREKKAICAVGLGVAGLLSTNTDLAAEWSFAKYSLTAMSVFELAHNGKLGTIKIIPEDAIKELGGVFSASEPNSVHVIVDKHLVTGQNHQSTLCAVQNAVLLVNQRTNKAK